MNNKDIEFKEKIEMTNIKIRDIIYCVDNLKDIKKDCSSLIIKDLSLNDLEQDLINCQNSIEWVLNSIEFGKIS